MACIKPLTENGKKDGQVSRRLRHKNITITAQFYGHLKAKHTTAAVDSFQRLAAVVL